MPLESYISLSFRYLRQAYTHKYANTHIHTPTSHTKTTTRAHTQLFLKNNHYASIKNPVSTCFNSKFVAAAIMPMYISLYVIHTSTHKHNNTKIHTHTQTHTHTKHTHTHTHTHTGSTKYRNSLIMT